MKKRLRVVFCAEREPSVASLYQIYLRDLSKFSHVDADELQQHLARYFGHRTRVAVKFILDSTTIGFALIRFAGFDTASHSIDDFFMLKKYRRFGYGKLAARTILSRYGGRWTISQIAGNRPAILFWRAVIERYYTKLSKHVERNAYLRSNMRVVRLHTYSALDRTRARSTLSK
jgi:predicted acetyltransferase